MAREATEEVTGAGGSEGDDIIPGVEGGDGAGGAAGGVVCLADLEYIVCLRGVLEDDLIAGLEVPRGRPSAVVGAEVPCTTWLADVVDCRRCGAQDGHRGHGEENGSRGSHCG